MVGIREQWMEEKEMGEKSALVEQGILKILPAPCLLSIPELAALRCRRPLDRHTYLLRQTEL